MYLAFLVQFLHLNRFLFPPDVIFLLTKELSVTQKISQFVLTFESIFHQVKNSSMILFEIPVFRNCHFTVF